MRDYNRCHGRLPGIHTFPRVISTGGGTFGLSKTQPGPDTDGRPGTSPGFTTAGRGSHRDRGVTATRIASRTDSATIGTVIENRNITGSRSMAVTSMNWRCWTPAISSRPPTKPSPQCQRNQFGASLGGPVRKNRTFFADYEGRRARQGSTQVTNVPTPAERNGDFSNNPPGINPYTQQPSLETRFLAL